jgi:hypothetical protein
MDDYMRVSSNSPEPSKNVQNEPIFPPQPEQNGADPSLETNPFVAKPEAHGRRRRRCKMRIPHAAIL